MNSSIPFRELLLQQQQQTKLLAESAAASAASSIAGGISSGGNVSSTNTEITASAIISSVVEQDRIAHFQERDRLILQHQQHQLQRKQKHQKQLNDHEKPFNSSNRIRDFVIGGGVDRVTNNAAGKTSGKWTRVVFSLTFSFSSYFLHVSIHNRTSKYNVTLAV